MPKWLQWAVLVILSAAFALLGAWLGLPASLLIGPMIAGLVLGVSGVRLAVPPSLFIGAQAAIGAMVAASISPAILVTFGEHWLLFSAIVGATLLGGAALGWLVSRSGFIAGATAVYGLSPGAAGPMIIEAEANGADARLVAFMLYVRVLMVVFGAALVGRVWSGTPVHFQSPGIGADANWHELAVAILVALGAQQAARVLRIPAWGFLGPALVLAALHASGLLSIALPGWLLAAAYAVLGWYIGLGFRSDVLRHAWRVLPVVAAAALCLIVFCALLGGCVMLFAEVDALTAYLATTPGGLDSVAAIAASIPQVDMKFVLGLQCMRLLFAVAFSPLIARLVVRHSPHLRR